MSQEGEVVELVEMVRQRIELVKMMMGYRSIGGADSGSGVCHAGQDGEARLVEMAGKLAR